MNTPEYYRAKLRELGFDHMSIQASTIPEAKESIKVVTGYQKELSAIKREVNSDMKEIRAYFRNKAAEAGGASAAVFHIMGSKKAAGQMRAADKRKFRNQKDQTLKPYEDIKITIDDLISQFDAAKKRLKSLIDEIQADEQAAEVADEEKLESLLSIHLETTHHKKTFPIKRKQFSIPAPPEPPIKFNFDEVQPAAPILNESGLRGRFSKKYREQVEIENQENQIKYEKKLEDWETKRQMQKRAFQEKHESYRLELERWNEKRSEFEVSEEQRIQQLEVARLSDKSTMEGIWHQYIDSLQFLDGIPISCIVMEGCETIGIEVEFLNIDDWPVEQKSAIQRGITESCGLAI